ncbi:polyprenyl synthetase family protein [Patescibacteria group bacterium]|nr:polyprenyl synthetase family protein [Patescibacteria group bacterium]
MRHSKISRRDSAATEIRAALRSVEREMRSLLKQGLSPDLQRVVLYPVLTGGKRLRPRLVLLSCKACGGKLSSAISSAAAVELLHEYSLLVDDIIDHSDKRRNAPTLWKKYGTSIAECAGVLYAAALMASPVSQKLSRAFKELVEGEVADILLEQAGREEESYVKGKREKKATRGDYERMVVKKTGALFRLACELGAEAARAPSSIRNALGEYGAQLGIAFQVADDLLDIYGGKEFGKPKGQDIAAGKLGNILVLFALEELRGQKRKELLGILRKPKCSSRDTARGIALLKETGAKERAFAMGQEHAEKAQEALGKLPESAARSELVSLADSGLHRNK